MCKSSRIIKDKSNESSSAVFLETTTAASAPESRGRSISALINDLEVRALVDSGSDLGFLDIDIAKRLHITTTPSKEYVSTAQCSVVTASSGTVLPIYKSFKFSVLSNLCPDIILGRDFMKLHQGVEFTCKRSKSNLTICGVICMSLNPPSLFPILPPDCKPVLNPTRRHSTTDETFIRREVQALLR